MWTHPVVTSNVAPFELSQRFCWGSCLLGCRTAGTTWPWRWKLNSPSKRRTAQHSTPPTKPLHTHPKSSQHFLSYSINSAPCPLPVHIRSELSLTRPTVIQSTPPPIRWRIAVIVDRKSTSFSSGFHTQKINLFSTIPCILHSPPILPSVFSPPKLYLVSSGRSRGPSLWRFLQAPKIDRKYHYGNQIGCLGLQV